MVQVTIHTVVGSIVEIYKLWIFVRYAWEITEIDLIYEETKFCFSFIFCEFDRFCKFDENHVFRIFVFFCRIDE